MAMIRVSVQGAELLVQVRGDGSPAVLFIHGFPFDHTLWRHQSAALSRWTRIVPDLRGAGKSSVPSGEYSVARYATDCIEILDNLAVDQAVICGLSMGGYIAFELARRHAQRIRALILCNTKATADSPDARQDRDTMAGLAQKAGARAVADRLLPKLLARATLEAERQVGDEVRQMMVRQPVAGIVGALQALRDRPDSTPLLAAIQVPVLVIAGDDDQIAPAAGMEEMARAIPNARFALIPRAGHVAPLEQPLAVSAAVADFLATLS
jgi:3-oxoadipate enol-lactonase